MPDKMISDYMLSSPLGTDKLMFQTAGGDTYYTTWGDVYHYAHMYEYSAAATAGIPTVVGTYRPWVKRAGAPVTTPVEGESNGILVDEANATSARFEAATDGCYKLAALISFKISTGTNQLIQWSWAVNGAPVDTEGLSSSRLLSSSSDVGNCSPSGLIPLRSGDYVDIRVKNATASPTSSTVYLYTVSLVMVRVGMP